MGIAQVFWEMLGMMFNIYLFISLAFLHHVRCGDCCTDASLCDPTTLIQDPAESPYFGTVDILPDLITKKDKSDFKKSKKSGAGTVQMWQGDSLQETPATMFTAVFKDGLSVSIAVNAKISPKKAKKYAKQFAKVLGRVPSFFRTSVRNLHLFPGKLGEEACGAWGHFKTGTISLCVEDGLEKIKKGTCEELFVHECTHVTVDPLVLQDAAAYACAMSKDQQFISTYAMMNPFAEDVAESLLMWYAVRVTQDRVDKKTRDIIEQTIPHRLEYFDMAAKNFLR